MTEGSAQRASLFIGSSEEGRHVADAIALNLSKDVDVTIWPEGIFPPNHGYLESLVNALERFDFAVLVLSPDDTVSVRNEVIRIPRANVMFELGLFMGRLGRSRTFAVCSDAETMKLPTDLAGVSLLSYNSDQEKRDPIAATRVASAAIRTCVRDLGVLESRALRRLSTATNALEGVSKKAERMIFLMARSRILELELIEKQFARLLPQDYIARLAADLNQLKAETQASSTTINPN
jgi:hypothetical protein